MLMYEDVCGRCQRRKMQKWLWVLKDNPAGFIALEADIALVLRILFSLQLKLIRLTRPNSEQGSLKPQQCMPFSRESRTERTPGITTRSTH